jgi:hypothetical protein
MNMGDDDDDVLVLWNSGFKDYTAEDGWMYLLSFNVCGASNNRICNGSVACEISTETHQLSYIFARDAQPLPTWSLLDASKPGKGIRMEYINGDLCWPGSAPRPRVVGFEFVCGPDQETMVADIREGPECLYTVLTSSYACGNASPLINTCNYTIPQLGLIYDLSSLRTTTFDYNTTIGDIMYTMSFCGHSNLPLCSSSNNSACAFAKQTQLGLGGMERTPRGTCNPKCWYHLMECLLACPPLV